MAPALTVIPDHTLQLLDHLPSEHVALGPDPDHLIGHLVERNGAETRILQSREAMGTHDDLACDMKTMLKEIVSAGQAHMRI
jgi:hypothetical protein